MAVQRTDPSIAGAGYTPSVNFGAFGTAILDGIGANIVDGIADIDIPFLGQPFAGLHAWANQLRQDATDAVNNAIAISQGVTGNITGSTQSGNASDVGTSVAILNNTVQSSSQPPQTVIITATQDVTVPTGCRTVVMNIFGGSGGGARGAVVSGSGLAGGAGGVGGWQKDLSLPTYSLTSTLHCVVGTKGIGATTDGTAGTDGGTSYVANAAGTTIYAQATGGKGGKPMMSGSSSPDFSTLNGAPGSGNGISSLPGTTGGHGGIYNLVAAAAGANGLNVSGGNAGSTGGGNGTAGSDDNSTLIPGNGGSGGGGGAAGSSGNAGNGAHGGHPAGAGGGGGAFYTFGQNGSGGDGADGEIWLTFVF
jgi:hypothetical protein